MKSSKIKKILAGVQIAALVASVTILTSCCHGNCKNGSCGSCGSKMKMQQSSGAKDPNTKDPNSSCGKGSCGKGSCSK